MFWQISIEPRYYGVVFLLYSNNREWELAVIPFLAYERLDGGISLSEMPRLSIINCRFFVKYSITQVYTAKRFVSIKEILFFIYCIAQ